MKNNVWATAGVVLALIGGAALMLINRDSFQKLGDPGVKLVDLPTYSETGEIIREESVYLPESVLNFSSSNRPISEVVLGWLPSDTTYGQRLYQTDDDFFLQMSVVLMGTDRTSIHKPEYCLTGQGWTITKTTHETVPMTNPRVYELPVTKMVGEQLMPIGEGKRVKMSAVYVFWFVADEAVTAKHNSRMVGILKDLPTGVLQRWAYVSAYSVCVPGNEDVTFEKMKQFIAASVPEFQLATPKEEVALR